ncbi:hypothetical protein GCM10023238_02530 [Streptomyces heliomycini]
MPHYEVPEDVDPVALLLAETRRGRPLIYMDTSALVTWMTRRSHWGALDTFLQERATEPLATSTLGFVETVRTLGPHGALPEAPMEDLDARITEILLTREVRDAAALLVGRLRTLDAIHVASALSLRDDLTALVTYDRRMLETARAEGLPALRARYGGLTRTANCRNPTGGHESHCRCPIAPERTGTDRFSG